MCLGIPAQITAITDEERQLATVSLAGVEREVCVACVCEPGADLHDLLGSWVLVHVGFAMARISQAEADASLRLLSDIGELDAASAADQDTQVNQ